MLQLQPVAGLFAIYAFTDRDAQVMGEIEAKSELVREQDREYSRVQVAHEQMAASLALATSESRMYAARIDQMEAEMRRDDSTRGQGTCVPCSSAAASCVEHRTGSRAPDRRKHMMRTMYALQAAGASGEGPWAAGVGAPQPGAACRLHTCPFHLVIHIVQHLSISLHALHIGVLSRLLHGHQVQSLQGGGPGRHRANGGPASPSSEVITSDDIISARLLSFEDIQVWSVMQTSSLQAKRCG